jgi:hypothetical protein
MLVMSASEENEPGESSATDAARDDRPLSRLAERFRVPLGIVVALIGAALAVVFAVRPLGEETGARGLVTQGAGVALWMCVVGVGVTWALDSSRKVTNGFALAGVACYALFWLSGL